MPAAAVCVVGSTIMSPRSMWPASCGDSVSSVLARNIATAISAPTAWLSTNTSTYGRPVSSVSSKSPLALIAASARRGDADSGSTAITWVMVRFGAAWPVVRAVIAATRPEIVSWSSPPPRLHPAAATSETTASWLLNVIIPPRSTSTAPRRDTGRRGVARWSPAAPADRSSAGARARAAVDRRAVAQHEAHAHRGGCVVEPVEREHVLDRHPIVDPVAARLAELGELEAQLVVEHLDVAPRPVQRDVAAMAAQLAEQRRAVERAAVGPPGPRAVVRHAAAG